MIVLQKVENIVLNNRRFRAAVVVGGLAARVKQKIEKEKFYGNRAGNNIPHVNRRRYTQKSGEKAFVMCIKKSRANK